MSNAGNASDLVVTKPDLVHTSTRLFTSDSPLWEYKGAVLHPALGEELTLRLYDAHANRYGTYGINNVDTGPQTTNMPGVVHQLRLFEEKNPSKVSRASVEH